MLDDQKEFKVRKADLGRYVDSLFRSSVTTGNTWTGRLFHDCREVNLEERPDPRVAEVATVVITTEQDHLPSFSV